MTPILSVMYDYCQWHYGLFQVLAVTPFCFSDVRLLTMALWSVSGLGYDTFSVSDVRLLSMALWSVSGPGVAAECTADEVGQLTSCITSSKSQVFSAFGNNTTTCNRSKISSEICG